MKIYRGVRTDPSLRAIIYTDEKLLDMVPSKLFVKDYDVDCLEWGYGGAGPSQTAAAILYDLTNNAELSKRYHQNFKTAFIAKYNRDDNFTLLEIEIRLWLEKIQTGDYSE